MTLFGDMPKGTKTKPAAMPDQQQVEAVQRLIERAVKAEERALEGGDESGRLMARKRVTALYAKRAAIMSEELIEPGPPRSPNQTKPGGYGPRNAVDLSPPYRHRK
jgi:acyl-CoA reductase-like NAD-dependent aldehyde dehydrogenase